MAARIKSKVCVCAAATLFLILTLIGVNQKFDSPSHTYREYYIDDARMRKREVMSSSELETILSNASRSHSHILVRFQSLPGKSEQAELKKCGLLILDRIHDSIYSARVLARISETTIKRYKILWASLPNIRDKMPGVLAQRMIDAEVDKANKTGVAVYFYDDVDDNVAENIFCDLGITIMGHVHSLNALLAILPLQKIDDLCDRNEVKWIEPLLPPFERMNDGIREAIGADIMQDPPHNLNGSGINVLIYDKGSVDLSHPDFSNRVTPGDFGPPYSPGDEHATHVAGTIGGDGSLSGGQYRGMAPAVEMFSYNYPECLPGWLSPDPEDICFYNNPEDIETDYQDAINSYSVHFANNSIGMDVLDNEYTCVWLGNYEVTSQLLDAIACGSLSYAGAGVPFLSVWPAGNDRAAGALGCYDPPWQRAYEEGCYYTVGVPASAKNIITVGAIYSDSDEAWSNFVNEFYGRGSGYGPTIDGRIKPEICAPGCRTSAGVMSTTVNQWGQPGYKNDCGTSSATAAVSGCVALLYQKYHQLYPSNEYPSNMLLPSTVKAILVNSARDIGNPNPDYRYGFGAMDIEGAIEQLFNLTWGVGELDQPGHSFTLDFYVPSNVDTLRATVAWDDPPGPSVIWDGSTSIKPLRGEALVNDLFAKLIQWPGISGGNIDHHAWSLDPEFPDRSASNSYYDNLLNRENNIYQIEVFEGPLNPNISGMWRLSVKLDLLDPSCTSQKFSYAINVISEQPSLYSVVESPNGSETWAVNSEQMIKWNSHYVKENIQSFDILYTQIASSADPTYSLIDNCSGDVFALPWRVPDIASHDCKIKVIAHLEGGETHEDESDRAFSIYRRKTDWNPESGVSICTADNDQSNACQIADGSGGAILAWQDDRSDNNGDIYAQRTDSEGNNLWTNNGIVVCNEILHQVNPQIVPDGFGGAVVTWQDYRNLMTGRLNDIYAQKIDGNGNPQWANDGISICSANNDQKDPKIILDVLGGAIITWCDQRNGNEDIYAQRIDANGVCQWTVDGAEICIASENQKEPQIVSDGASGAIIMWYDERNGNADIYAQRIDFDGNVLWPVNGVAICASPVNQEEAGIIADGNGGAIISWQDNRSGDLNIYAQRVTSSGTIAWIPDGIAVCTEQNDQLHPRIAADNSQGAIIAWNDLRHNNYDVFAQRINMNGLGLWQTQGIGICTDTMLQYSPEVVTDGSHGAIITWRDDRRSSFEDIDPNNWIFITDLFAQHIDSDGTAQWQDNGAICPDAVGNNSESNYTIIPDGLAGALVAWTVIIETENSDVYAQRIKGDSQPPDCEITAQIYDFAAEEHYSLADTFLFGCPKGDGGFRLEVTIDFEDTDMAGVNSVPPQDIALVCLGLPFYFWSPASSGLQTGTPENGYVVTCTRKHTSAWHPCTGSCAVCPSSEIPVYYKGNMIGYTDPLSVRSPDYNCSGKVDLSDLASFRPANPGDPDYNDCWDLNGDDAVDMDDRNILVAHYQHQYEGGGPLMAEPLPQSEVVVTYKSTRSSEEDKEKICMTIYLSNAHHVSAITLGIDKHQPSLVYSRWINSPACPGYPFTWNFSKDGRAILCFMSFGMDISNNDIIEIGTIEYIVAGEDFNEGDVNLSLVIGDVVDTEGDLAQINRFKSADEETLPALINYLANNYPNPFNPTTTIEYSIADDSHVNLTIYNVNGQIVRTLVDEYQQKNQYKVLWDGKDNRDVPVASGVYFYRIRTNNFTMSKKLILLR